MIKFGQDIFLDSGAHGLYSDYVLKLKRHRLRDPRLKYAWYLNPADPNKFSDEFREYLDQYAAFVKKYEENLHLVANVDIIFNPELTWKIQMYFEEVHGIVPLPVIHHGTPMKWLEKYLERDYDYIALGGLGQEVTQAAYRDWADDAFDVICSQPNREPLVKVHGFALTSASLMRRYPWYSVDSTSWLQFGSYGQVIMPRRRKGKWVYDENYIKFRVSPRQALTINLTSVAQTEKEVQKQLFMDYINEKGFPLGESKLVDGEWITVTEGLVNSSDMRCAINAMFFIDLSDDLPKWPWAFKSKSMKRLL